MGKFPVIILVFLSATRSSLQVDYCYSDDENPYSFFSSETSYSNVRSLKFEAAENCEPIYMWNLIKHGTTYMSTDQIEKTEKLFALRDEILKNHDNKRGKLCQKDLFNFQNWNLKLDKSKADQLVTPGMIEQIQLARRFKVVFSSLFKSVSKELYEFQTSTSKAVQDSGIAFAGEILHLNVKDKTGKELGFIENSQLNSDSNFEFDDKEMKSFSQSAEPTRVIKDISTRLGFENVLTTDILETMYSVCSFETAWGTDSMPAFCAAFQPDELKIIEYGLDLGHFYNFGYGNTKNENFGKSLFEDMLTKIIDASDGKFAKKGSFYFSESSPVAAIIKRLNLYHDEQPIKQDNYEIMKDTRKWRSSFIDCFATNIIAVLYSCSIEKEKRVQFYHNENLIKIPHCEKIYCTVEELKKLKPTQIPEPGSEKDKPKEKNDVEPAPKNQEENNKPKNNEQPSPKSEDANKPNGDKNEHKNQQENKEEIKNENSGSGVASISCICLIVLCLCSSFSIFAL